MPSERNNILPVSASPNQSANIQKTADWPTAEKPRISRQRLLCYSSCAAIVAAVVITIIVLSFTVLKVRDPTMKINSIKFNQLDPTKNLTVVSDVSVKNPNVLTFRFNSSTTTLSYRSTEVGSAVGPPGTVGGHGTLRTNVTMDVNMGRLLNDSNFAADIMNGSLGLQTSTMVGGKVTILGLIKRHVDVMMNCTVIVSIGSQEILDQQCTQRMRL